jgi:serine/threonine-protein phosphatase 2A regulatory subunit B
VPRAQRGQLLHSHHADAGENPESSDNPDAADLSGERMNTLPHALEYRFYTEYQAHESEFDALKSTDIEPRVTSLCWAGSTPSSQHLLSANDKSIKLWKLHDKEIRVSSGAHAPDADADADAAPAPLPKEGLNTRGEFLFPSSSVLHVAPSTQCRRIFRGAHSYHVNSVSAAADQATFVSADDLVVNLWSYEHPQQSFSLVNIKPAQLEEITEVITRVSAHPQHAALVAMATSRGSVSLLDTRARSTCETYVRSFERAEDPLHKTFFTEVVHCTSDVKFVPDGRHLVTRDYFNVYVWDLAMEQQPVATVPVHDYLRSHMCDLYENDCLFDQFRVDVSPDGQRIATGSYHNHFIVHNVRTGATETLEAGARNLKKKEGGGVSAAGSAPEHPNIALMDFSRRAQYVAWHPQLDVLAVAGVNKLYIYQAHEADARL